MTPTPTPVPTRPRATARLLLPTSPATAKPLTHRARGRRPTHRPRTRRHPTASPPTASPPLRPGPVRAKRLWSPAALSCRRVLALPGRPQDKRPCYRIPCVLNPGGLLRGRRCTGGHLRVRRAGPDQAIGRGPKRQWPCTGWDNRRLCVHRACSHRAIVHPRRLLVRQQQQLRKLPPSAYAAAAPRSTRRWRPHSNGARRRREGEHRWAPRSRGRLPPTYSGLMEQLQTGNGQ
jgi:hypothetical protein